MPMIDSPRRVAYIAASLAVGALLLVAPRASDAASGDYTMHLGATLPKWAKKVGDDRFRSPWGWDTTMKWIDRTYGSADYPRIRIVNLPGIKAIHLRNRRKKGDWEGVNIYEKKGGEVRFFVVARKQQKKPE